MYHGQTFKHWGFQFQVRTDYDDIGAPWEEHDGHGPVREVKIGYNGHPPKAPGERALYQDRYRAYLYDFAEAVRIAKRDEWGFLPGKLELSPVPGNHAPYEKRGGWARCGEFYAEDPEDINKAIRAVYEQHRATMTPGEYAAGAVERDFNYLYGWANDQWTWVTLIVTLLDAYGNPTDEYDTLGGLSSEDPGLEHLARELAEEIIDRVGEDATELVIPEKRIPLRAS